MKIVKILSSNEIARTRPKNPPEKDTEGSQIDLSWDLFGATLGSRRCKGEFETESASKRKKKRVPESEITGPGTPSGGPSPDGRRWGPKVHGILAPRAHVPVIYRYANSGAKMTIFCQNCSKVHLHEATWRQNDYSCSKLFICAPF